MENQSNHLGVKVSIVMITYMHEEFIRKAIEGVLMQRTNFDFELIIANDCSSDSTDMIVRDMMANHPKGSCIKYFSHPKNIGMMPNFIFTLEQCKGTYIAICEGDDYWIDECKLQKQIDFLEANNDYSICFHKAQIEFSTLSDETISDINASTNETTTLDDIVVANYIHTPTVVFRKPTNFSLPEWYKSTYPGDWPLFILLAQFGKIKMLEEKMAVYRVHDGGIHSKRTQAYISQKALPLQRNLTEYFRGSNRKLHSFLKRRYIKTIAYNSAILDLDGLALRKRVSILIVTGLKLGSPIYWLRASIILFAPNYYKKNEVVA